jgi:ubiquinol-cytochrome c reductase iron-sulfur subunit
VTTSDGSRPTTPGSDPSAGEVPLPTRVGPTAETEDRHGDGPMAAPGSTEERRLETIVGLLFGAAALAGLGLLIVYILGGQTQLEGLLLGVCLGGIGIGIVVWGQRLMPARIHVERRGHLGSSAAAMARLEEAMDEETAFSRRKALIAALGLALGGLAAAVAIPVFSLGPAPGRRLFTTSWTKGASLAPAGGRPGDVTDLPIGGIVTVFPDGDASDPNAATLLIHVRPGTLELQGAAAAVAPDGFVAYSKICTHAGCPVGLYRSSQQTLICPCHQSEFAVLRGAMPINGPAARPLPQLPIHRRPDGTFVALGDYPEPVGPSFWDRTS